MIAFLRRHYPDQVWGFRDDPALSRPKPAPLPWTYSTTVWL